MTVFPSAKPSSAAVPNELFDPKALAHRALAGPPFTKEEMLALLRDPEDPEVLHILCRAAHLVRLKVFGNVLVLRGIIEFSNICRNDCLYCGLRRSNRNLVRYRMDEEEIFAAVERAIRMGFRRIVLQSGEDGAWHPDRLVRLVREIVTRYGVVLTLSVGELPFEAYRRLMDAGAYRYLMRHETSDPELYARLHPGTSFGVRREHLYTLKSLGYATGPGMMVGLPGQTLESLVDDVIFMRELRAEMAGVGPFIPHPETPLRDAAPGSPILTLKMVALTRLNLPETHLPATTALRVAFRDNPHLPLLCGPNVVMPDVTPPRWKVHYDLYPGKTKADLVDDGENVYAYWERQAAEVGLVVD
ncbi:[FeFe] hydrogenase H-cluster radical SAM maturase HydE [Brockia lithotrophica]|uniref:Biotin synthase n=1 Tax=Brockia lithotrophica TaxID=933949 RepID=A0A660L3D2_9BACL|nr:[FeFe] hydrogenase H-cluster radical SAM maturase HydE [Brockia lithotrophica]RKQ88447.1 biotin synthase [Brockia lithotrophica]